MLRACYTATIRPYRDSDREVTIRWYFVPDDRPLVGRTRFGSGNYTNAEDEWPGPGEVKGRPRPFSPGGEPFTLAHHEPEGPRDWWVNGCPVEAAHSLARSPAGAPEHCIGGVPGLLLGGVGRFAAANLGGLMLGSVRGPVRPADWTSSGGLEFGGSAEVTVRHRLTSDGGLSWNGSSPFIVADPGGLSFNGESEWTVTGGDPGTFTCGDYEGIPASLSIDVRDAATDISRGIIVVNRVGSVWEGSGTLDQCMGTVTLRIVCDGGILKLGDNCSGGEWTDPSGWSLFSVDSESPPAWHIFDYGVQDCACLAFTNIFVE